MLTPEYFRQLGQFGNVGHGVAPLPIAHRLIGNIHPVRKFHLRHTFLLSQLRYLSAYFLHIEHFSFSFF